MDDAARSTTGRLKGEHLPGSERSRVPEETAESPVTFHPPMRAGAPALTRNLTATESPLTVVSASAVDER